MTVRLRSRQAEQRERDTRIGVAGRPEEGRTVRLRSRQAEQRERDTRIGVAGRPEEGRR